MDIQGTITRKIGPLPVWAWGAGVGAAWLAWTMIGGGSTGTGSGDDDDEEVETQELSPVGDAVGGGTGNLGGFQDTSGIQGLPGPKGDTGEAGAKGAAGRPGCPVGYKPVRTSDGKKWKCQGVKKPKVKKGYKLVWSPNTFTWKQTKKKSSLSLDDLHQVPHSGYAFAPNGSPPTISDKDIPAIALMPPDHTPRRPLPVPLWQPGTFDPPIVPRIPPSRGARPYGRPYYGKSHEGT